MKITVNQLRKIIKEEIQRSKFENLVKEAAQYEKLNEGFFDKVKGVFGKGLAADADKLRIGVRGLQNRALGTTNVEKPESVADFIAKAVQDSGGFVKLPKQKRGFQLSKILDSGADLPKQIDDLKKKFEAGKLDDERFSKQVSELTGIDSKGWGEFSDFVKALIADAEVKVKAAKQGEQEAQAGRERRQSEKEKSDYDRRYAIASRLGVDIDDFRVQRELNRGRDDSTRTGAQRARESRIR